MTVSCIHCVSMCHSVSLSVSDSVSLRSRRPLSTSPHHFLPCFTLVGHHQISVSRRRRWWCWLETKAVGKCSLTLLFGHGTPYVHRKTVPHPRRMEVELASAHHGTVCLVVLAGDELRNFSISSSSWFRRHCVRTLSTLFMLSHVLFVHAPSPASMLRRSIGITCPPLRP